MPILSCPIQFPRFLSVSSQTPKQTPRFRIPLNSKHSSIPPKIKQTFFSPSTESICKKTKKSNSSASATFSREKKKTSFALLQTLSCSKGFFSVLRVVEMADNPKSELAPCRRNTDGIDENSVATPKISVLDHLNGIQYTAEEKSDNFVIDMESFSNGTNNKDNLINPNSRITLQRSLSRKGSSRGGCGGGSDTTLPAASSSPRALVGSTSMPEKAASLPLLVVGTRAGAGADHSMNPQVHHQITITTNASNMNASTEGRFAARRNSFKRPPFSLALDPKRVLLFFATLSSMGTILLIYFTLSMGKYEDGNQ